MRWCERCPYLFNCLNQVSSFDLHAKTLLKHTSRHGQRSELRYTPSDLDYGTLLCWATNPVGKQLRPCTYTVFPAGKPDTVAQCR